jgi:hypothetical protein
LSWLVSTKWSRRGSLRPVLAPRPIAVGPAMSRRAAPRCAARATRPAGLPAD